MTIWCKHVHRLELQIFIIFVLRVHQLGIKKLLDNLKPHKASGPDSIPPTVLKELSNEIAPILQIIFQISLTTGQVPDDWKEANVAPIFQKEW